MCYASHLIKFHGSYDCLRHAGGLAGCAGAAGADLRDVNSGDDADTAWAAGIMRWPPSATAWPAPENTRSQSCWWPPEPIPWFPTSC